MVALSRRHRAPDQVRRLRPRYRVRFRRAVPAVVLLLGLSVLAGTVWLRVLERVEVGAGIAAGCGSAVSPLDPRRIQVRVYNATDREGLARQVSGLLRSRGFAVVSTANDPLVDLRQVRGSAEVRFGPKGAKQADVVRRQVPGATFYRDVREDAVVDLALGPGFRRLSTEAEVAKGRRGIVAHADMPPPTC